MTNSTTRPGFRASPLRLAVFLGSGLGLAVGALSPSARAQLRDPPAVEWAAVPPWAETEGYPRNEGVRPRVLQVTDDGGAILAGWYTRHEGEQSAARLSCLWRFDREGNRLWAASFGGPGMEEPISLLKTADGGFVVCGRPYLAKFDGEGGDAWLETYWTAALVGKVFAAGPMSDGGFVLLTSRSVSSPCELGTPCAQETVILKTDAVGAPLWEETFPVASTFPATARPGPYDASLQWLADGGMLILAVYEHFPVRVAYALRTDPTGHVLWSRSVSDAGPCPADADPAAMARISSAGLALRQDLDGEGACRRELPAGVLWYPYFPEEADGTVFLGTGFASSAMLRYDASNELVWRFPAVEQAAFLLPARTDDGGYLVAYRPRPGDARPDDPYRDMSLLKLAPDLDGNQVTPPAFRRGDANADGSIDISDAVTMLEFLFLGAAGIDCEDATDVNDDGQGDISDPVSILGHLFLGSAPPPGPFALCGTDPTADELDCVAFGGCP